MDLFFAGDFCVGMFGDFVLVVDWLVVSGGLKMIVRLLPQEIQVGATVAIAKNVYALWTDAKPTAGCGDDNYWDRTIEGYLAEMAVAKAMGAYWAGGANVGVNRFDVGELQVRHTVKPDGCLIIRERDPRDDIYILVVGRKGEYRLCGWIRGSEAERLGDLRKPNGRPPARFIAQNSLHRIDTLLGGKSAESNESNYVL